MIQNFSVNLIKSVKYFEFETFFDSFESIWNSLRFPINFSRILEKKLFFRLFLTCSILDEFFLIHLNSLKFTQFCSFKCNKKIFFFNFSNSTWFLLNSPWILRHFIDFFKILLNYSKFPVNLLKTVEYFQLNFFSNLFKFLWNSPGFRINLSSILKKIQFFGFLFICLILDELFLVALYSSKFNLILQKSVRAFGFFFNSLTFSRNSLLIFKNFITFF